ncbi:MAG: hypothetical protein ACK53Y_15305, partial [bacterium]
FFSTYVTIYISHMYYNLISSYRYNAKLMSSSRYNAQHTSSLISQLWCISMFQPSSLRKSY